MQGMDAGPGTPPGALAWFVGVWVVMMAAMMLPSVALYAQLARGRAPWGPLAFSAGYLLTWSAAGVFAYVLFVLGRALLGVMSIAAMAFVAALIAFEKLLP
jgi:predicted metal-binding membrane protein